MKNVLKSAFVALCLLVLQTALAQDKTRNYYLTHLNEILPDAQQAFDAGRYERAVELCDWYYILDLDAKEAPSLKEKAARCAELVREINSLVASGRLDEARTLAETLRNINPKDSTAISPALSSQTPTRIEMKKKFLNMVPNDLETIQVDFFPSGGGRRGEISWQSSNPEIVSVDSNGTIRTHATGEATITASWNDLHAACVVTVVELALSEQSVDLFVGDEYAVNLTSQVDDVEWTVSNPSVASVEGIDEGFKVSAKQIGSTVITATKGRSKVTCRIEVESDRVDMGLPSGNIWSARNLGARLKSDRGDSFDTSYGVFYIAGSSEDESLFESNIAEQKLGSGWTIPTSDDYQELLDNCRLSYTNLNGRPGVLMRSKINGSALFFPTQMYNHGAYWVDAFDSVFYSSFSIYMDDFCGMEMDSGHRGSLVRAVYHRDDNDDNENDVLRISDMRLWNYDDTLGIKGLVSKMDAEDIQFLTPEIRLYSDRKQNLQLEVRITDWSVPEDPLLISYNCDLAVERGYSSKVLSGWGRQSGGFYKPGKYDIEIWVKDMPSFSYSKSFILHEQATVYDEETSIFLADVRPSFNGGDLNEFSKWVNTQLVYPEIAKENGVQGRVTVQFTVTTSGQVRKVHIVRGVDQSIDQEAMRVVSSSPRWKPAEKDGHPVDVWISFPIVFQLR